MKKEIMSEIKKPVIRFAACLVGCSTFLVRELKNLIYKVCLTVGAAGLSLLIYSLVKFDTYVLTLDLDPFTFSIQQMDRFELAARERDLIEQETKKGSRR